jgi:hypothetical protein
MVAFGALCTLSYRAPRRQEISLVRVAPFLPSQGCAYKRVSGMGVQKTDWRNVDGPRR